MMSVHSYYSYSKITFILLSVIGTVFSAPDIQLLSGTARGFDRQASESLKPYFAYYGIPFAEPPVDELRFLPPRPLQSRGSGDIITSNTFRAACWQPGLPDESMSEDCLHLNVFSPPDVDFGPPRKVMVWIHGGGFSMGNAGLYGPSRMVTENDVIVVTIQYRLGALGFLSSGDDALPGNMGIRDQILALQWVKDNIVRFAGDADDVTIFGESAGSASVAALCVTPATRGLFKKAIMQSGTILSPWALLKNPREQFYEHSKNTDCFPRIYNPWNTLGYHESIVACLKRKSPKEILEAQVELPYSDFLFTALKELPLFAPRVEGYIFPRAPASLLADQAYLQRIGALDRSYVLGLNDNEGALLGSLIPRENYDNFTRTSNVAPLIKSTVRGYLEQSPQSGALNLVDFMYTFPREANDKIPLQKIFDLNTDIGYLVPTMLFARALVKASPSTPVYLYLFDAEPKLKDPNGPLKGTGHGMDIYFEFDVARNELDRLIFSYADPDPVKYPLISKGFRDFVTSFAKTGVPVAKDVSSWPRFDLTRERYVALSTLPEVRERMFAQRVALWTDYLPKVATSRWFGSKHGRPAF